MRILCLDVGKRRIGIAVSDPMKWIAQGVATLERKGWGRDLHAIAEYCRKYEVSLLVIGLPLDSEGEEGEIATLVRQFAERLEKYFKDQSMMIKLDFWDESFSSQNANLRMKEGGLGSSRRKKIVDKMAAVSILQDYLECRKER